MANNVNFDAIMGGGLALVVAVIMSTIVSDVVADAGFTGLADTISTYLVPLFLLGALVGVVYGIYSAFT